MNKTVRLDSCKTVTALSAMRLFFEIRLTFQSDVADF